MIYDPPCRCTRVSNSLAWLGVFYARAFRIFSIISSQCTSRLSETRISFSRIATWWDFKPTVPFASWVGFRVFTETAGAVYNNVISDRVTTESEGGQREREREIDGFPGVNDQLDRVSRLSAGQACNFNNDLHALTPLITTSLITERVQLRAEIV